MTTYFSTMNSPVGELLLTSNGRSLTMLAMSDQKHAGRAQLDWQRDDDALADACAQLAAYFAGERHSFDLPLDPGGTDFQRRVWRALRDIPSGVTESYGALAKRIESPGASRAVGLANGRNPIAIIIPCHRVIGANGRLTGYAGGLERKRWLLTHEGYRGDMRQ